MAMAGAMTIDSGQDFDSIEMYWSVVVHVVILIDASVVRYALELESYGLASLRLARELGD